MNTKLSKERGLRGSTTLWSLCALCLKHTHTITQTQTHMHEYKVIKGTRLNYIMILLCSALVTHAHNQRHSRHKVVGSRAQRNTRIQTSATIKMCKQKGRFPQGCFLSKAIICLSVIRQNRPYTRNQHFLDTHVLKTLFKKIKCCSYCLFLPKAFLIVGWWHPAGHHILLVLLFFQSPQS